MKYMLDTNICLYIMKRQPPAVAERFANCRQGDVVISAITLAELEYGVYRSSSEVTRQRNRQSLDALVKRILPVPFEQGAARAYALVRAAAPKKQRDALDKLIASHAKSLNLTLVTNNLSDFRIYPNLNLENWVEAVS
ncbi:type II toxin-antitoxin system VapC family toxin [cf. Phormidesmis sp. LEGE 11477]|uniref:type II toxin-antitoxin system VapC family toxin n=1 Tax=cf. Phormidesmis sp. LEGE 11477 TaxID=1828680 RepID=UPI00187F65CA|nr:type II toxin-antitoxin system VapC family toxin [cf. Phormidesmis sp. LEGE 11477]MBE9062029.1 type II toxin-antitoxin system VapC family toxin [cf. Phormidesmis sp. LEGE 11477]